ncbi:heme o synthase [Caldiplasma sukawensis]
MNKKISFKKINSLFKIEITFLIDMVAIAGFFTYNGALNHIWLLLPLLVSGSLASFSSALFNNLFDRDIDSEMNRVSSYRSIVRENSTSILATMVFFIITSIIIGVIFLNLLSLTFIISGFLSYSLLYTVFLKRKTSWNIVIGGIAGSFPALAGSAAAGNIITTGSIIIAAIVFLWTPTHFWSLAIKYRDDYNKAGVPMLPAVKSLDFTRKAIFLNTIVLFIFIIMSVFITNLGILYFIVSIVFGAIMLFISFQNMIKKGLEFQYMKLFGFSNIFLLLVLISVIFLSVQI